jgi:hypothetical protein
VIVILRSLAASGLAVSAIGAALDFLSAYQMTYNTDGMMMASSNQFLVGAAGLSLLGLVVAVTGLAIALPRMGSRMGLLGLLMEIYGILMGLAGAYVPRMDVTVADGMLVVGAVMFLNGLLMQWRRRISRM